MYKSFVVRIYPDEVQESFFINQFGCCRFVFNTFLDAKKTVYSDSGEYLSFYDCSAMLTELKKSKDWLKRVDSQALIESLKNLENAFDRFFKHLSNYPCYKSKYNPVQSYKTNNINNNIRIEGKRIRLPKVGWIRFRTHQKISGKIQSVTVKKKHLVNILFLFYVKMLQGMFLRVMIVVVV
jgi:putative transposase